MPLLNGLTSLTPSVSQTCLLLLSPHGNTELEVKKASGSADGSYLALCFVHLTRIEAKVKKELGISGSPSLALCLFIGSGYLSALFVLYV